MISQSGERGAEAVACSVAVGNKRMAFICVCLSACLNTRLLQTFREIKTVVPCCHPLAARMTVWCCDTKCSSLLRLVRGVHVFLILPLDRAKHNQTHLCILSKTRNEITDILVEMILHQRYFWSLNAKRFHVAASLWFIWKWSRYIWISE